MMSLASDFDPFCSGSKNFLRTCLSFNFTKDQSIFIGIIIKRMVRFRNLVLKCYKLGV